MIDRGDDIIRLQHALVQQETDGQHVGVVADGHGRDDFLTVEENGQRFLDHHGGLDRLSVVIDTVDPFDEARIVRAWPEFVVDRCASHDQYCAPEPCSAQCARPASSASDRDLVPAVPFTDDRACA